MLGAQQIFATITWLSDLIVFNITSQVYSVIAI